MRASDVVAVLESLEPYGIECWLDGGWGVDALLGTQTREHADVDLIVDLDAVPKLRGVLGRDGFELVDGELPSCFVLEDAAGRRVDVHPVVFGKTGNGIYKMQNGEDWVYLARWFHGDGTVEGYEVHCLTAEGQVACHAGAAYEYDADDFSDMQALHDRFGVKLPPELRR